MLRPATVALCFSVMLTTSCSKTPPVVKPVVKKTSLLTSVSEWPRWRGPNFDAASADSDWNSDWSKAPPKKLWDHEIGVGYSSFAIAEGRLVTMGSVAQETEAGRSEPADPGQRLDVIWCFDADSGEVIWTLKYPAKLVDKLHAGGPSATPTLHEGLGYSISKEGYFVCFDAAAGKELWSKELATDLRVPVPTWGFCGSPLVWEDLVIVEAGKTVAFDRITGELIWETNAYRAGYSSPVSFLHPDTQEPLIASLNNEFLLLLRPRDGSEFSKAKFETPQPTTACTPLVIDNTIFLSSGYDRGCVLFQLQGNQLTRIYDNKNMRNHMNSCVYHNGYVFGFDGMSRNRRVASLRCLEHTTGELMWKKRGFGVGSLLLAGDRIIALSDEGELIVVKATHQEFTLVASNQILTGQCWTPPVLCQGRVFARNTTGTLVCLDLRQ